MGLLSLGTIASLSSKRALVKLQLNSLALGVPKSVVVLETPFGWRALDAVCPHADGPLHLGPLEMEDIEDLGTGGGCQRARMSLVCPWHAFRFDVDTGNSLDDDGLVAHTMPLQIQHDELFLVVPPGAALNSIHLFSLPTADASAGTAAAKDTPSKIPPSLDHVISSLQTASLVDWAIEILNTPSPRDKVALTHVMVQRWNQGMIQTISSSRPVPDRPARDPSLSFVDPAKTKRRGKGGSEASRIAILHALANVEQWAIDLALDMIARFHQTVIVDQDGNAHPVEEQREFFTDFVRMAGEEATHFTYLVERLESMNAVYGDLPVHEGLWDSATYTKDDWLARLVIVHMVHEARGLDVNPQTIGKFSRAGDVGSVEKLEIIHRDEVTHVASGQRWFSWACSIKKVDRYTTFHDYVRRFFDGSLKPPFNESDRLLAGLDPQYYMPLVPKKP
ncbi:hypothetical protein HDV03_003861 [Kappamyces sp. JEL0829]|nr:hypothetical protein HDV03_003861 [Kappamyces sp. JEL0829]